MKARFSIVLLLATLSISCGGALAGGTFNPLEKPQVAPDRSAEFTATCRSIWQTELGRPIDTSALADCLSRAQAGATGDQIRAGVQASQEFTAHQAQLAAAAAAAIEAAKRPSAGESGRVHVDGLVFRREDGTIYQWRGATDFLLFKRFLDAEDIQPILTDRITAGANVVRVLGMVDSFAHLWPQERGDYYDQLGAFLDLVAERGLRVEFVVFADAQIISPDAAAERAHLARVADVLSGHWNSFLETTNEPFKNIPGGDETAAGLCRAVMGRGFPVASGAYTAWPPLRPCDYGTTHSERKPEWPRTAKDLFDLREPTGVPWVSDEPTGFAEVADGDKRSTSADDAAYFAGVAALEGAGATFHSDAGVLSVAWGPVQRAAAVAFYAALRWVPAEAQAWPYQRGGDPGTAGVGNMPIDHDDALALRTFCKGDGGTEWCIAIRPTDTWRAIPRDRWQIADQPRRGFVRLVR